MFQVYSKVIQIFFRYRLLQGIDYRHVPGGPEVKTALSLQHMWVRSLVRELRSRRPCSTAKKKKKPTGTSLVVQWLRLHTPNAGVRGLIPCQGTRSYVLQLRHGALKLIN